MPKSHSFIHSLAHSFIIPSHFSVSSVDNISNNTQQQPQSNQTPNGRPFCPSYPCLFFLFCSFFSFPFFHSYTPPPSFRPPFIHYFTTPSPSTYVPFYHLPPYICTLFIIYLSAFFVQIPRYTPPNYLTRLQPTSSSTLSITLAFPLCLLCSFSCTFHSRFSTLFQTILGTHIFRLDLDPSFLVLVSICLTLRVRQYTHTIDDTYFFYYFNRGYPCTIDYSFPHDLIEHRITRAVVYIYPTLFLFHPWARSCFQPVTTFSAINNQPFSLHHFQLVYRTLSCTFFFNFSTTCPPYTHILHNDNLTITNTIATLITLSKHPLKVPYHS